MITRSIEPYLVSLYQNSKPCETGAGQQRRQTSTNPDCHPWTPDQFTPRHIVVHSKQPSTKEWNCQDALAGSPPPGSNLMNIHNFLLTKSWRHVSTLLGIYEAKRCWIMWLVSQYIDGRVHGPAGRLDDHLSNIGCKYQLQANQNCLGNRG